MVAVTASPLHRYLSLQFAENKLPMCIVMDNARTHDGSHQFRRRTSSKSGSSHHRRTDMMMAMGMNGRPPLHGSPNSPSSSPSSNANNNCRWTESSSADSSCYMNSSIPPPPGDQSPHSTSSHRSMSDRSSRSIGSPNSSMITKQSPTMPTRKNTPPQHVLEEMARGDNDSRLPMMPIRKKTPPQHKLKDMVNRENLRLNPQPTMVLEALNEQHRRLSTLSKHSTIDGGYDTDSISYQSSLYSRTSSIPSQTSSKCTIRTDPSTSSSSSFSSSSNGRSRKTAMSSQAMEMPPLISSRSTSSGRKRSPPPSINRNATVKSVLSVQKALGLAKQRCAQVGMADELRQLVVQAIEVAEEEAMSLRSARRTIDESLHQQGFADVLLDDDSTIDPRSMGLAKHRTGLSLSQQQQPQRQVHDLMTTGAVATQ